MSPLRKEACVVFSGNKTTSREDTLNPREDTKTPLEDTKTSHEEKLSYLKIQQYVKDFAIS